MECLESDDYANGRARVRGELFEPLEAAGMIRRGRQTVTEFGDMKERIAEKLAYMTAANLRALRELIERHATGRDRDQWPKEITILAWARGLQSPPPRAASYAMTLMLSAMGRRALAGGYHVELYGHAVKYGPPPSKYDLAQIERRAESNRHKCQVTRERIASGRFVHGDDRKFLDWYMVRDDMIRALLNDASQSQGETA